MFGSGSEDDAELRLVQSADAAMPAARAEKVHDAQERVGTAEEFAEISCVFRSLVHPVSGNKVVTQLQLYFRHGFVFHLDRSQPAGDMPASVESAELPVAVCQGGNLAPFEQIQVQAYGRPAVDSARVVGVVLQAGVPVFPFLEIGHREQSDPEVGSELVGDIADQKVFEIVVQTVGVQEIAVAGV